jgi:hypothetical protein
MNQKKYFGFGGFIGLFGALFELERGFFAGI